MSEVNQYVDPDKLNTSEVVYSGIQFIIAIAMIVVGRNHLIQIQILKKYLDWSRV